MEIKMREEYKLFTQTELKNKFNDIDKKIREIYKKLNVIEIKLKIKEIKNDK